VWGCRQGHGGVTASGSGAIAALTGEGSHALQGDIYDDLSSYGAEQPGELTWVVSGRQRALEAPARWWSDRA
jgi:hypothetical protein